MEIKKIDAVFSVAPQITATDLEAVRDAGFRTILCNRPDGEGSDQPPFDEIAEAARKLGLDALYQPVIGSQLGAEEAKAFDALFDAAPKPVLAYCRSGARCTMLWSLSQAGKGAS